MSTGTRDTTSTTVNTSSCTTYHHMHYLPHVRLQKTTETISTTCYAWGGKTVLTSRTHAEMQKYIFLDFF